MDNVNPSINPISLTFPKIKAIWIIYNQIVNIKHTLMMYKKSSNHNNGSNINTSMTDKAILNPCLFRVSSKTRMLANANNWCFVK